jgi:hypothetical protein
MKERELAAWEQAQQQGFAKFVVINGVLSWGLPMLIIIGYFNNVLGAGATLSSIVLHCVIWFSAGGIFGAVLWWISSYRYQKYLRKKEPRS